MEKVKPFYFDRADTCPKCKCKRSIEAYTNYNTPIHLTLYLDKNNDDDLKTKYIHYMKCRNCGTEFYPEWHNNIPYAVIDSNLDLFLDTFDLYKNVDP